MEQKITDAITKVFAPVLKPVFHPMNDVLSRAYMPWAIIAALALFASAVVWVFTLRREYVNLDAPSKHLWHDLRLWTILSMLPHVVVYLYFQLLVQGSGQ